MFNRTINVTLIALLVAISIASTANAQFNNRRPQPMVEEYDIEVPYWHREDPNSTKQVRNGKIALHVVVRGVWSTGTTNPEQKFVRFDSILGSEPDSQAIYVNPGADVEIYAYTKDASLNETMFVRFARAGWKGNDMFQFYAAPLGMANQVIATFWSGAQESQSDRWTTENGQGVWPIIIQTQGATGLVGLVKQ